MDRVREGLESIHRWRQAANWTPVVLLPLIVYWHLTDRTPLAIGAVLAGFAFYGFARGWVYFARCPACETRFGDTPAGFRRGWEEIACEACGVSLFELRRGRARDKEEAHDGRNSVSRDSQRR